MVCRDLTDPSVSSCSAWVAGHGVQLLGMLWWDPLHGPVRGQ